MATSLLACGFECLGTVTVAVPVAHFTDVTSNVSASSSTVRSGAQSLRINPTASSGYVSFIDLSTSVAAHVSRFYVRFATLPSANCYLAGIRNVLAGYGLYFNQSDSKLYCRADTTNGANGFTVTTGVWYRIDLKVVAGTPITVDVQVDGTALSQASAGSAATGNTPSLCVSTSTSSGVGTITADVFFEDYLYSQTAADYPLGPGYVLSYIPNADGTHNVAGAADFKHGTGTTPAGTDITNASTDAWQDIDKRPLVTSAAGAETLINMIAPPNATDYVEIQFEDSIEPSPPRAVEVIIGINQAGTGNGNMEVRLNDNGTMGTVYTATGVAGVAIATGVQFKRAHFADPPSAASAWVLGGLGDGDFNDLRIRFGSPAAVDANPDQYLIEAMFEAEYQPALPQALYGRPFGQPGVKLMPQLLAT